MANPNPKPIPPEAAARGRKNRAKKPSARKKAYVANRLKGMSGRQAALEAGYAPSVADNSNRELTQTLGTREALVQAMKDSGVSDDLLANTILDGITAETLTQSGIPHPDHRARLQFIKYVNELADRAPSDKLDVTSDGKPVNFGFGDLLKSLSEKTDPDKKTD